VAVAATPGEHDTHYVEVILTVANCDANRPCRLVLGHDGDKSDQDLRGEIVAILRNHPICIRQNRAPISKAFDHLCGPAN
jgi:hypothetical protein